MDSFTTTTTITSSNITQIFDSNSSVKKSTSDLATSLTSGHLMTVGQGCCSTSISTNALSTTTTATTTADSHLKYLQTNNEELASTSVSMTKEQQNKLNNWSGNHDSSNSSNNQYKQQQQHHQGYSHQQQQQKTSYELYKEAAEQLGLSCTLCDNCRCLDCQVSQENVIKTMKQTKQKH